MDVDINAIVERIQDASELSYNYYKPLVDGVMWEEVGIDPGLPFEEKVKLYHMQMLGL